jgi:hypothetical protein
MSHIFRLRHIHQYRAGHHLPVAVSFPLAVVLADAFSDPDWQAQVVDSWELADYH